MTQLSAKDSKKKGKHARVMISLGGSTLDLARHPDLLSQFDVRIVADVDDELRRVCPSPIAAEVMTFTLGYGHTSRTLAKNASPKFRAGLKKVAPMNARTGLGQCRTIGDLAAQDLLNSPEMSRFLNGDLVDMLLQCNAGMLDHVSLVGKGGTPGGTGEDVVL